MFAFIFHEYLFIYKLLVSSLNVKGPFYVTIPIRLLQPGPPLSQRTTGSLSGSLCDSKKT